MEKIPEHESEINEESKEKFTGLSPDHLIPGIKMEGLKKDEYGSYVGNIIPESGNSYDTSFSNVPLKYFKDLSKDPERYTDSQKEYLKEGKKLFSGVTVVDLGCGNSANSYELACILGAKGYIGIDSYNADVGCLDFIANDPSNTDHIHEDALVDGKWKRDWKPIPYSIIKEDIVSFLKRVPDESVGIFCFGLDNWIIGEVSDEYFEKCGSEISRVIKEGSGEFTEINTILRGNGLKDIRDKDFYKENFSIVIRFLKKEQ